MKSSYILYSCLFLFFFSSISLKAQKDFVVLKSGDTVKGDFVGNTFSFRSLGTRKAKNVSPSKIASFFRSKDSVYYVSVKLPHYNNFTFAKLIENGRIKLVSQFIQGNLGVTGTTMDKEVAGVAGYDSPDRYILYTIKDNGNPIEIKTSRNGNKDDLSYLYNLIGDNKALWDEFIAEKKLSVELVRVYIRRYNNRDLQSR